MHGRACAQSYSLQQLGCVVVRVVMRSGFMDTKNFTKLRLDRNSSPHGSVSMDGSLQKVQGHRPKVDMDLTPPTGMALWNMPIDNLVFLCDTQCTGRKL